MGKLEVHTLVACVVFKIVINIEKLKTLCIKCQHFPDFIKQIGGYGNFGPSFLHPNP